MIEDLPRSANWMRACVRCRAQMTGSRALARTFARVLPTPSPVAPKERNGLPLLPSRCRRARDRIDEVVAAHLQEAAIVKALLADEDGGAVRGVRLSRMPASVSRSSPPTPPFGPRMGDCA